MKITQNRIKLTTLALLVSSIGLNGSWTLIDDFESGLDGWLKNDQQDAIIDTYDDPAGGESKALWIDPNTYGVTWGEVYYSKDLGGIVGEGETATFYFRVYMSGHNNNVGIAITDGPLVLDESETFVLQPASWGHAEPVMAISNNMEIRDGNRYAISADLPMIQVQEWYEFWLVMDNTVGTSGDEYKVYFKTESMAEPSLIRIPDRDNPETLYDTALFRNGTEDDLTRVMIVSHADDPAAPNLGEPVYWDDFYIDFTGENLTSPASGDISTTWAGFDVDSNGIVDTGDWLGVLYVHAGSDFVYSYTLENWMHFPEPDVASGGWSYVFK